MKEKWAFRPSGNNRKCDRNFLGLIHIYVEHTKPGERVDPKFE